ncbi:DUF4097 family beta strand repeat-containing protein [Actinomycetospora sp. NBRC 106378]|uniref:DUF4097 family beta strand repeat-containing protein n=1 Tax=Actinomycetospora sp. NBRC 106378 TaxID=3032208 RepID=UPI0024A2A046|nr:DUF4097 family beta strand repeat-containing protein [Actinomycetospora sp. NBRC 106378]GLZ55874.1 hypothetical protein Acsp07_54910 [Actinomycetospora sp. NBRC 106378]
MPTFDTPGPVAATVTLPIGELRVVASDRTDTTVEVRSTEADRAQADAVRVDLVDRDLRVTGRPLGLLAKLTPGTPGRSIEVVIGLPSGSALTATTHYGAVTASGRLGTCAVTARYGDVLLEDTADTTVTVGYGQARVAAVDGDAAMTTDYGAVQVGRIAGTASLRSRHGSIRVDEIVGDADLTGTYEPIDVDTAQGDVRVRTTHGAVRLGSVARGEVTLSSTHGRLEVGIAADSAAWLDVDTAGRISNDLTPRDDPDGFAETVSVHARSQDGAIVLRRVGPSQGSTS